MATGEFPDGVMERFTFSQIQSKPLINNETNQLNYFGLIYATILPPRDLFLPILPARLNSKLMFVLCAQCGLEAKHFIRFCQYVNNKTLGSLFF